ncbi:uncharacterized protein DNG_09723 [Cephalotrichum gorgonifer]|uniref:Uncharacterized protein n=1 Tax=Cephalotrichum gorgonifer TaxID=2041049 RepID=A0AAE8N7C5_9PEZI|nr:uncharacterized protein DNG_09723 [Cephalotrichum gorgonifer]
MALPAKLWPPRASQVWLLVCNIGIFALAICVLASCRSPSEANYSLLNFDRPFLRKIIGDECFRASEGFARTWACREVDGAMDCEGRGQKLEWVTLFEADLVAANTTDDQAFKLDGCMDTLNGEGVDHALAGKLATALFALLISSTILGLCALIVAFVCGSGFALPVFVLGLIDEIIIITCIGLFIGIINHEVGRYIPSAAHLGDIDDKAALGVGFWLLVAILGARAISHPLLFALTLVVSLAILVIPIVVLLGCCPVGESRKKATVYVRTKVMYVCETPRSEKEPAW